MRPQSGGPGQPFDCLGRRGVKYGAGKEGRRCSRRRRREREREGGRDGGMKERRWKSQSILADGFTCPPHCSVSFQPHPFGEPYAEHILPFTADMAHTHTCITSGPAIIFVRP